MTPLCDRFMRYVDQTGDCWLWTGAKSQHGYGRFLMFHPKRTEQAHRISYELHKGPIPVGLHVCHTCDNPSCVNPAHLWVGTAADNARDRDAKNRVGHGEKHYAAKLTSADVAAIIKNGAALSQSDLARMFGVHPSNISHILAGRRWKRLTSSEGELPSRKL